MVINNGAPFANITSSVRVTKTFNFKKPRYSNIIHHHPVRLLLHFLVRGTSEVCAEYGVRISDVIGSKRGSFVSCC